MKFKLDENIDPTFVDTLSREGIDADTVLSEGISGCSDEFLLNTCKKNNQALISLDLDFSNPLRFPPSQTGGIIVLRPRRPVLPLIRSLMTNLIPELKKGEFKGNLWIVEFGRIRVYESE